MRLRYRSAVEIAVGLAPWPAMNDFVTVAQLAAALGISRPTVYRAVRSGLLPAPIKASAHTTRWRRSALEAVLGPLNLPE